MKGSSSKESFLTCTAGSGQSVSWRRRIAFSVGFELSWLKLHSIKALVHPVFLARAHKFCHPGPQIVVPNIRIVATSIL